MRYKQFSSSQRAQPGLQRCEKTAENLKVGFNSLELRQGRVRVDSSRNFLLERVLRPWQELPREV